MKEKPSEMAERERKEKILTDFEDKKKRYQDFWDPIYKEAKARRRFTLLGKQLDDGEKKRFGLKHPKEPNLLLTYVNHEANQTLQTDFLGKVTPNGGGATIDQARARQDVLRGIQRTGKAPQVFNFARRDQVATGIAYAMATLDWRGKRGFGKMLGYKYLEDTYNVFPDITVNTATFSDARDFLIKEEVAENEWEEKTGQKPKDWGHKKKKELWNYWVREDVKDTEYLLETGKSQMRSEMPDADKDEPDLTGVKMGEDGQPLARPTSDYTWCWYKIAEKEILDEEEWLGSYSPLVACTGRRVVESENVHIQSMTLFAEEPQWIYTVLENIIQLRLSKSPYSKWKVAYESIDIKQMIELRQASAVGDTDILYKSLTADGKPIPPPEEIEPHVLDMVLIELQKEQEMKIQKVFGIFDANLGNKSNEQSGVAIENRAKGGEISNFDFQFNFTEFVEQLTRVQLDLIPKYLTAPQQIAFVDKDDNAVIDWINTHPGNTMNADEEYDLCIEASPISKTAREEEAQSLMNMAKLMPVITQNIQAVATIIRAQPGRYASKIADFLVQGDPNLKQAQQQNQELNQKLQQTTMAAQAKQAQDSQTIAGLKNTVGMVKQQMGLIKQSHAIQGQSAEVMKAHEDMMNQMDAMDKALDRQVAQYTAENGRISAEAAMLKVVGDLSKPEPATPAPGQGLP